MKLMTMTISQNLLTRTDISKAVRIFGQSVLCDK